MKRIVSLILVFTLVFVMVVPAQASSLDPDPAFVDLLALAEESSFIYFPASTSYTARLTVPANLYRYIDCLFYSDVAPSGVGVFVNDLPLNVVYVGDNLYRAYGTFNVPATFVDLVFNFGAVCSKLNIISCRASALGRDVIPLGGSWNGYTRFEDSVFESGTFDGIQDTIIKIPSAGTGTYVNYSYGYNIKFYPGLNDKWQAYDEIDLMLAVNALSVNSITAYINNVDVLKSVSLCDNGTFTDLRLRGDAAVENEYAYYFEASNDTRWVIITLDLTKVQKSTEYYPNIRIDGIYEAANQPLITISRCVGVVYDDFDVESSWLKRIFSELKNGFSNLLINFTTWFNLFNNNLSSILLDVQNGFNNVLINLTTWFDLINNNIISFGQSIGSKLDQLIHGSSDQQSSADDFQQSMDDQSQELEDLTGDLSAVNKTPVEDVNVNVSGMVNPDVVILATNGIGGLLSNQIILRVFLMAITLALAGFILYGKR